jgi:hypothetical protein
MTRAEADAHLDSQLCEVLDEHLAAIVTIGIIGRDHLWMPGGIDIAGLERDVRGMAGRMRSIVDLTVRLKQRCERADQHAEAVDG